MASVDRLSKKELAELNYYDFRAYLGVPLFQFGALRVADDLVRRCGIREDSRVLEVGCGTGFMASRIVKDKNCRITGIDISERMIGLAAERARSLGIEKRAVFRVADACSLPFEDSSFDVVFAQFVLNFLDKNKAFAEFIRVLKPGGYLGIVEMCKDTLIPYESSRDIIEAEAVLSRASDLNFRLSTPLDWKQVFEEAGIQKIQTVLHTGVRLRDRLKFIQVVGRIPATKIVIRSFYHWFSNSDIRRKFSPVNRVKKRFLSRSKASKYIGLAICVGVKPGESPLIVSRGHSINL